jgi:hypothetical protein
LWKRSSSFGEGGNFWGVGQAAPRLFLLATRLAHHYEIAAATKRLEAFCGHFLILCGMKLVEAAKTISTDPAVYDEMVAFGAKSENAGARER